MTKKLILLGLFFMFMFTGISAMANECEPATLNLEQGIIDMPCVKAETEGVDEITLADAEAIRQLTFHVVMEQRGNSMNWSVRIVEPAKDVTTKHVEEGIDEPADEDIAEITCEPVLVDLGTGLMELPCVVYDGELFEVHMTDSRGNSSNWEVDFISQGDQLLYRKNANAKNEKNKDKVKGKDDDEEVEEEDEAEDEDGVDNE